MRRIFINYIPQKEWLTVTKISTPPNTLDRLLSAVVTSQRRVFRHDN